MANWNNPTLTSTYTNFVTEVKDRDVEAAVWFEGMSPTNLPTNAKRLNTTTGRFEKWNGSAWVDAVATFTFPALTVDGAATFNGNTTIGDAGTDTLTVNAAATFAGTAAFNGNVTLGDAAGDAVTVNATLSFATAPVLTPGTANGVMFLNGSKVVSAGSALAFDGSKLSVSGDLQALGASSRLTIWNSATPTKGFSVGLWDGTNVRFESFGADMVFQNYSTNYFWGFSGTNVMCLTSTGLAVGGTTIGYNAKSQFVLDGGSATNSTVNNSGVLVSRTTGSSGENIALRVKSGAGISGTTFAGQIIAAGNNIFEIYTAGGAAPLIFGTNSTERVRVDGTGNLIAHSSVTGHWQVPRGTTAQRPTGDSGMIRFNSTLGKYEGHNGSAWSSIGGGATGGGSDDVFYENGQTVTTNYTLTTNKNAMSAGPITIASGITVTVPSGSNWAVV